MDESAPISWIINQINQILASGAGAAAGAISDVVSPIAAVCFGIYMILVSINYLRGAETEPVMDLGLRLIAVAVIIGLGLNASNYTSTVMPMVTGIGNELASKIASAVAGGNDNSSAASALDSLALAYLKILSDGYQVVSDLGFSGIGSMLLYGLKAGLVIGGLAPFLVAATLCIIAANVGSYIIAMVGPLFFAFLLFPATRQYFSAWLNTAFSYALIPVFVAVISVISIKLSNKMLLGEGTALGYISFTHIFLVSLGNLMLLFLLRQVNALASSLSAGGINAAMPGGLGALAKGITRSAGGTHRQSKAIYDAGKSAYRAVRREGGTIRKAG